MKIYIEKDDKTLELKFEGNTKELLKKLISDNEIVYEEGLKEKIEEIIE